MNLLFLMDPFVDLDPNLLVNRAFSLDNDLCIKKFVNLKEPDSIYLICLSSIYEKSDIKKDNNSKINVIEINDIELYKYIRSLNISVNNIISNSINNYARDMLKNFFASKIPNSVTIDFIIYWELCTDFFFNYFKDVTFLEANHSGFYRLENKVDLYYIIKNNTYFDYSFYDYIKSQQVSTDEKDKINNLRNIVKSYSLYETNITREYIDPDNKFKKILYYPLHLESSRFYLSTEFASQENFINYLLDVIPKDFCIVITKHPLQPNIKINNDRIIDLSKEQQTDKNLSIRLLNYVDGLINVFSSIYTLAMLFKVPIFSYGKDLNAKFCSGSIESISSFFQEKNSNDDSYNELSYQLLKYLITHKFNISSFQWISTTVLYFRKILENKNKNIHPFPEMNSIEGYSHQFISSMLVKPNIGTAYKENENITQLTKYLLDPYIVNIGFDIFDTLIQRPMFYPKDLFELMDSDVSKILNCNSFIFPETRILAEKFSRKNKVEVTFDDIYDAFESLTGITSKQRKKIQQLELEYEKKFTSARHFLQNYFYLAQKMGKNVFIISDMYHSSDFLKSILIEKGFNLENVKVYVSSEYNKVKHDGSLFKIVLKNNKFIPSQTLFIGDNKKSDIQIPQKLGMHTFHIPKCTDEFFDLNIYQITELQTLIKSNWGYHLAFAAINIFDNPFLNFNKNTYTNNSESILGYLFFGPLVLSLLNWIVEEINDKNYELILFTARDSKLIMNLYNYLNDKLYNNKLPQAKYLHISRTALIPAYNTKINRASLLNLYVSNLKISEFLKTFFDIDVSSDNLIIRLLKKSNLKKYFYAKDYKAELLECINDYYELNPNKIVDINEKISLIKKYFISVIGNKKFIFFDLGTRATTRNILEDLIKKEIHCLLFRTTKFKYNSSIKAYMKDSQNPFRTGIRKIIPDFYESILSDNLVTTCQGYANIENKVKPMFETNELSESDMLILNTQNFISLFVTSFVEQFNEHSKLLNIQSKDIFVLPISRLSSGLKDRNLLEKFVHDNPLSTKNLFQIIPHDLNKTQSLINTTKEKVNIDEYKNLIAALEHRKKIYKLWKSRFYKFKLGKIIWDFGRSIYLNKTNKGQ